MTGIIFLRSHYPDTRLEKEALTLTKAGYNVKLLVWDRGRIKEATTSSSYEVKKFRVAVPQDSVKVVIFLPIWWGYLIFQLISEDWDAVHASDFDTFFPSLLIARLKNKPIVYDIFDFYADTIRFPIFPRIFRTFFSMVDRVLLKFANVIILPDESRRMQIGSYNKENVVIIVNSPPDILSTINQDLICDSNFFRIFFGGYVTEDRGIHIMCQAVKTLPEVMLLIKGPCSEGYGKKLKDICQDSSNIQLNLEWIPYNEIIKQTMMSDSLFAFYDPKVPNNQYASPNKLFESMMCSKPIIVNKGNIINNIIQEESCGLIVPYGDVESLKNSILTLKGDQNLCKFLGDNGRNAYNNKFSWRIMEGRLLACYDNILNTSHKRKSR